MSDVTRSKTNVTRTHRGGTRAQLTIARTAARPTLGAQPTLAETTRLAGRIGAALTLAVCGIGVVVQVTLAATARRWLAFPFGGVPARPSEAVSIFTHNLRAVLAVGGLLLVAQSPHWTGRTSPPGAFHQWLQRLGAALLCAAVTANLLLIGAGLGAYGIRMVWSLLPDGPVELVAYALALALYRQGRHRPLPLRHVVAVAMMSVAALALAAILETYVNL